MAPELHHAHDRFFKETFGRPDVAGDFLHHYLPPEIVAHLELDRLEPQRGTFIDPDLQEYFSDLLYLVPLKADRQGEAGAEELAFVYILFEHKSYPDRLVSLQLLRYMVRIWDRQSGQGEQTELSPILPLVFYHGRTHWWMENRFESLFPGPEVMRPYWPHFNFKVTDFSHLSDVELRGEVKLQAVLMVLKHILDPRLNEYLPQIGEMLRALDRQQTGVEYLYTFIRYLMGANEQVGVAEIRQLVLSVEPTEGEMIMTTVAQQLIDQGIEQGIEQGAQIIRNSITVILQQRLGLSGVEQEQVTARLVSITDLKQLEALNLLALQATSIDEFFTRLTE